MKALLSIAFLLILVMMNSSNAASTVIRNDNGGEIGKYVKLAKAYEAKRTKVVFAGECVSSCTVLLLPTFTFDRCMKPNAKFGFHQPYHRGKMTPAIQEEINLATKLMWQAYPAVVKAYLTKHGWPSYHKGDSHNKVTWMKAKDLESVIPYCQ